MKQSSKKLSENDKKFLLSLVSDGHKTDAEISREIHVSKASAGRIRKRLETDNILLDYIPVVNLDIYGINLYAVVSFEWHGSSPAPAKKMEGEFSRTPQVIYFASGEGPRNMNYLAMLGFSDLLEFHEFLNEFKQKYGGHLGSVETFFIPANKIMKQDFTELVKLILKRAKD